MDDHQHERPDADYDDQMLHQVDRLLERGKPSRYPAVNKLAKTRPQIDPDFQDSLEQRLMAQLPSEQVLKHPVKEKPAMQMAITSIASRRIQSQRFSSSFLTLAATLATLIMTGMLLVSFSQQSGSSGLTTETPLATQIVITTQHIAPGETITAEMVGVVSLSAEDLRKLRTSSPDADFFSDPQAVIGQTAALDTPWFTPLDATRIGRPMNYACQIPGSACPAVPKGYYMVNFPGDATTVQGLVTGNRVDVLALVDGELRAVVEDVLLVEVRPKEIVLAAPSWQEAVLGWLYHTGEPYALRLHTGETPASLREPSTEMAEYTITAPEPLPENYTFDLIVGLPVSKSYLLTEFPASIQAIQYTQRDTIMHFWYKNLEVVKVENGTEVTLRLPKDDAATLDYLIQLGATLTYIPDMGGS